MLLLVVMMMTIMIVNGWDVIDGEENGGVIILF